MEIDISLIFYNQDEMDKVDPESLESIKTDIGNAGLLHPITVQECSGGYRLVAGKVRLKSFMLLAYPFIPAKVLDRSLTSTQCRDIALSENLRRQNLQWYDQVELEKQLHDLRLEQHGKVPIGRPVDSKVGWSQADTAQELGLSMGALSQNLALANAIKRNPQLKLVKDKKTALKLIRHAVRREDLEAEALIPSDFEMDRVFLGDSLNILKQIPNSTFDACITDPPWLLYKDEKLTADESTLPTFKEIYRVLKGDSFLYAVVSTQDYILYREKLPEMGFRIQQYPLVWWKSQIITHGQRTWEYSRDYEPIILAVKGNPILTTATDISCILNFPALHHTRMIHPHEKPIGLMKKIIGDCTFEGAKILDPFAGSGVTLQAAREMGRPFIGIERDRKFYENIEKRLSKGE